MNAPEFERVLVRNRSSVVIIMKDPVNVDGEFGGFEVTMKASTETAYRPAGTIEPSHRSLELHDLMGNKSYVFRVRGIVNVDEYSEYVVYNRKTFIRPGMFSLL